MSGTSGETGGLEHRAAGLLAGLARIEHGLTFAAFLVLIVAVFADVLSREISGTGLHWARQTGVYANVVVVMFGLGIASGGGAHLRPRFADGWLPAALGPLLKRINDLGMAVFCIAFAVIAAGVVVESIELQERSVALRIAVWPFQSAVPAAFAIAGLRHLAHAVFPDLRPAETGALADGGESRGAG